VPASLKDLVLSVLGLQTVAQAHVYTEAATASSASGVVPHAPAEFASIYDATLTPTGTPYAIGIISAGTMTQTVADFKQFETQSGIPATPVSVIYSETPGATTGTQTWDIASQVTVGMAGQLKGIYFYAANSLLLTDIVTAFNLAVTDDVVPVINVSLGDCEVYAADTGFLATSDQIFQQGIAQGQTFFAASGNLGSHCDTEYKFKTSVEYPASSPYVTTVGGTTLTTTRADGYSSEAVWVDSGGGISRYEPAPTWQAGYNKASFRGLPDMAMDGDPASGAEIVVNGSTAAYGGTSLSTALAMGAWARVWAHFGDPTYFFSPLVYAYVPAFQSGAHDIVSGKNGPFPGFHARTGWDYASGFGTWDVYADIYGTTP
jgi:subtilase family serine protease